jgi:hypothetical protein
MKRVLVAVVLAASAVLAGCGISGDDPGLSESTVQLKSGESFDGAQPCGGDLQECPSGLSCIRVRLEGEQAQALCLDEQTVCDRLKCGLGRCAILESYPVQVVCR